MKKQLPPFRSLLVGLDFSEPSKLAFKQALKLGNQFQVPVFAIHVLPSKVGGFGAAFSSPPQWSPQDFKKVRDSMRRFYSLSKYPNVKVEIRQGEISKSVLKMARELPDPLILVGSNGRGAVSTFVLGSEAEKIALASPFPVWVHRGTKTYPMSRVLVPTDLSRNSHRLVELFQRWAKSIPFSQEYLFVRPEILPILDFRAFQEMSAEVKNEAKKAIHHFRKRHDIPISMVAGMDPSSQIVRHGRKYDMIAMSPHSKSGPLKKFGRTTAKVLRTADRPVLVFKV